MRIVGCTYFIAADPNVSTPEIIDFMKQLPEPKPGLSRRDYPIVTKLRRQDEVLEITVHTGIQFDH